MRNLLLGAAAIAMSGCSWLGLGSGHNDYSNYNQNTGYYKANAGKQATPVHGGCGSEQCLSRWNIEGGIGPAFIVGGTAVTGDELNAGSGAEIRNIKMSDAYDTGYRAELGGSYALNPNRKVTLQGYLQENDSSGALDWGTIGNEAFTGALSDYRAYGIEAGLRQYAAPRRAPLLRSVRPYVEGKLGAARVSDIDIEGAQLGGQAFNGGVDVPFYEGGWVPTAAGLVGLETPAFKHMTLGLETGIRYIGKLDTDTTVLSSGGAISGSNNGSDSWTIPVTLRARYRF